MFIVDILMTLRVTEEHMATTGLTIVNNELQKG
jgi:hypothetical protein